MLLSLLSSLLPCGVCLEVNHGVQIQWDVMCQGSGCSWWMWRLLRAAPKKRRRFVARDSVRAAAALLLRCCCFPRPQLEATAQRRRRRHSLHKQTPWRMPQEHIVLPCIAAVFYTMAGRLRLGEKKSCWSTQSGTSAAPAACSRQSPPRPPPRQTPLNHSLPSLHAAAALSTSS